MPEHPTITSALHYLVILSSHLIVSRDLDLLHLAEMLNLVNSSFFQLLAFLDLKINKGWQGFISKI